MGLNGLSVPNKFSYAINKNVPIQIIKSLVKDLPSGSLILDMGCGENWVKHLSFMRAHKIVGVDPYSSFADVKTGIDSDWSLKHTNFFDFAIALNSLHFAPVEKVLENIKLLISLTKTGSKSYITLNEARFTDSNVVSVAMLQDSHKNLCQLIETDYALLYSKLFLHEGLDSPNTGHHHFIIQKD